MKILLTAINAKYIHTNPALYSLRAYAGEIPGKTVEIAEYTINQRREDILADLYRRKPDMIAISCYIWNWTMVTSLLPELPKILPHTTIWLGGPEVSYNAEEILGEYTMLSGIMVGEGEQTFKELISGDCNLNGIAGIVYRKNQQVVRTKDRELTDISVLPLLYEDLDRFENRIIYYESSRGCPYRCSYCLSSIDKKVRLRDIDTVKRELQFFLDHHVKQVKFVDRTFNCNHEHAKAIWQYLAEHDNGVTNFHFEIEADILSEEEIELLSELRPGLAQMEIGVQTVNPKTLKEIRRTTNTDILRRVVEQIRSHHNIHIHLDLIAGLPYEDFDSFRHSFNAVYKMKPEQLQLGFLKVLKGTYMHEKAEEYGMKYLDTPPYEVLSTKWLSYDEILKLKQVEEMVETYYNSNQFTHAIMLLEQVFEEPFELYYSLGQFYEERGYFTMAPARAYRYQVLYEFAMTTPLSNKPLLLLEALTYDVYLRENAKSRPEFAIEPDEEQRKKQKIFARNFYETEEMNRKYLVHYEGYDSRQMAKMTHLEFLHYPLWQENVSIEEEPMKETVAVLFDYQKRNPLTYEAEVTVLRETVPMQRSFVCIDLETTGLDPKKDRIIEIGAVKVVNGEIVDTYQSFVNPLIKLEKRITELTGIRDEQLVNAPQIGEILQEVLDFIGDYDLLGHSVLFDYAFIKRAAVNNKLVFEKNGIDTLKIARKYLKEIDSRGLEYLCQYYQIEHTAHRALGDAQSTVCLYRRLWEEFYLSETQEAESKNTANVFLPFKLSYHAKREQPITIAQKQQLYKLIDKHKIKVEYEVERLSRPEASRQIDRILQEYGR